jgi:hypothetical protein
MLLDNTASGSSRLWRELGGLVLNPIGGFNRLIRGEMWKDFENPPDRFPTRFYAALDGFYRHRSGSGAEGTDQNQGGLSLTLRYGDAFDGTHAKPFEFFELETDLVHPADVLVTRSQIRGLIAESVLADAPETGQRLDVFMHFDYFNDTPVVFGSQQFSLDHLYRHCITADTDLRTEVGMTAMPMAALQVDYPDASLPTVGRSFDYGPGGGAQTSIRIRRRDVDLGTVAYNVLWQHTSNGISRNSRVQTLSVEGRAPIFGHLALRGGMGVGGAAHDLRRLRDREQDRHVLAGLRLVDFLVRAAMNPFANGRRARVFAGALVAAAISVPAAGAGRRSLGGRRLRRGLFRDADLHERHAPHQGLQPGGRTASASATA